VCGAARFSPFAAVTCLFAASGGPVGVGTATAKSMVLNLVFVTLIAMLGTQVF
jgi:ABC-type transporter Mla maintaining outer membrane lipid asymmetry permease subunit MlaE